MARMIVVATSTLARRSTQPIEEDPLECGAGGGQCEHKVLWPIIA